MQLNISKLFRKNIDTNSTHVQQCGMSTPHNEANKGDIAPSVLLPGDPLRAQFVAENYLDNPVRYNTVRNMYGFTGTYKGIPVSVQGTGMGLPSHLIYVTELITHYGCKQLIRIGSCGSIQERLGLHDVVMAMSASTTSGINKSRFAGHDFAACADFELFNRAVLYAQAHDINFHAGNILSGDEFYSDDVNSWKLWAQFGVLAVEMETNGLYTIAAKHAVRALSILTVSDSLVSHQETTPQEREQGFTQMMEMALGVLE